ncbi:MAG: Nif3-like dinuclear metal center hexameric protein [Eggerthellaceae bacterium]|nr:Nif3-like dinuclear metal center hexameric protein [Eggerthellaceae bacterium]
MADSISTDIAQVVSDVLGTTRQEAKTIGQLEAALLSLFPASDAEEWDKTGLLAGDPHNEITGIAIGLDATSEAVQKASDVGANVLLTHHPAFIEPPQQFGPQSSRCYGSASVVWEAISQGIALLNIHTALDVSPLAARVLPTMLGLQLESILAPINEAGNKGYGQLCSCEFDSPLKLSQLAARCLSVFGCLPRVYGPASSNIERIVTCTGSASNLVENCIKEHIDCLICGEVRYHTALDAQSAGLSIIELGHDVSELPLCAVLAQVCVSTGVAEDQVYLLDQNNTWWTPDAVRQ